MLLLLLLLAVGVTALLPLYMVTCGVHVQANSLCVFLSLWQQTSRGLYKNSAAENSISEYGINGKPNQRQEYALSRASLEHPSRRGLLHPFCSRRSHSHHQSVRRSTSLLASDLCRHCCHESSGGGNTHVTTTTTAAVRRQAEASQYQPPPQQE